MYEGVSKSFLAGRLERELQMVQQLSATTCSCIAILRVSLVSFASITLCVATQRVSIVVSVYFVIETFGYTVVHVFMKCMCPASLCCDDCEVMKSCRSDVGSSSDVRSQPSSLERFVTEK
jgi:hypothetical protein